MNSIGKSDSKRMQLHHQTLAVTLQVGFHVRILVVRIEAVVLVPVNPSHEGGLVQMVQHGTFEPLQILEIVLLIIVEVHMAGNRAARRCKEPRVSQAIQGRRALFRVLLQHLQHHAFEGRRKLIEFLRKLYFSVHDVADGLVVVHRLEWGAASQQLVDEDAGGPYVHFLIVPAPREHLGGPVVESASDGEHVDSDSPPPVLPAYAEIDNLYLFGLGVIEDVLWLDVPMCD